MPFTTSFLNPLQALMDVAFMAALAGALLSAVAIVCHLLREPLMGIGFGAVAVFLALLSFSVALAVGSRLEWGDVLACALLALAVGAGAAAWGMTRAPAQ